MQRDRARFERRFLFDSYANRSDKGTHAGLPTAGVCPRLRYVLRLDIVKHFPSMDHAILSDYLGPR